MERKLASIQRIIGTSPIEGADRIEIANVLGWQCVTQKSNNFKPGDLVVYFEIDSLIPITGWSSFLQKKPEQTEARLKTIKLKGQFSQGLILPISTIEVEGKPLDPSKFNEGDDLTDLLGIKKWEPEIPAQLRGQVIGLFPGFVSKTDETRIQSCPSVLEKNKGLVCFVTEKVDGSSITVFRVPRNTPGLPVKYLEGNDDEWIFGVCSKNLCVAYAEDNAFWKAVELLDLKTKLETYGKPIVLQGELYGQGIQKNKLQLTSLRIGWFNVVDPLTRRYFDFEEFKNTINELALTTVPILDDNFVLNHDVPQLVTMSIGKSKLNESVWREGIVIRPKVEMEERHLGRFSFKVINPEFLLKYDE